MPLAPGPRRSNRRVPLYEEVAEQLRQKIYDYLLPPGEWIDEPALAEELGLEKPVKDGDRLPEPVVVDDTSADPILNPVMITDGLPEWNPTGLQSRDQLNLDIIQQFREIESTLDLGDSLPSPHAPRTLSPASNPNRPQLA